MWRKRVLGFLETTQDKDRILAQPILVNSHSPDGGHVILSHVVSQRVHTDIRNRIIYESLPSHARTSQIDFPYVPIVQQTKH